MNTLRLWFICFHLFWLGVNSYAQVNLVSNGGFEELVSAHVPSGMTFDPDPYSGSTLGAFVFYDSHVIGIVYQLGNHENMFGYQEAFEGEKYGGVVTERQYNGSQTSILRKGLIKIHTNEILLKGYHYTLKFRVSKMDNSNINPNLNINLNNDQSVSNLTISDAQTLAGENRSFHR